MKFLLKSKTLAVLVCLCFLQISFAQVNEKDLPPRPSPPKLVNDLADVLNDAQEATLERKLVAYDDSTSTQIAVITVTSTGNYYIADYALAIGRSWGVGQKNLDNGIVLLAAIEDRSVWIATGYGTEEFITDARANRIIDEEIVPNFRNENYYAGFDAATDKMILYLQGGFVAEETPEPESLKTLIIIVIILILVIYFLNKINRNGGITYSGRGPTYWGGGFGGGKSFGGGGFGGFGGGGFGGGGAGGRW